VSLHYIDIDKQIEAHVASDNDLHTDRQHVEWHCT